MAQRRCQDYAAEAVNLHKFFANRPVLYQQVVPDLETCLTHELKNYGPCLGQELQEWP